MVVRNSFAVATVIAALAISPITGFAQSQTDRTGTGGVTHAAGQESSVATTALIAGGVIAAAIGIAVAVSSSDDENSVSVSTVTSTTTTR
jgi:hypothetical protein